MMGEWQGKTWNEIALTSPNNFPNNMTKFEAFDDGSNGGNLPKTCDVRAKSCSLQKFLLPQLLMRTWSHIKYS